MDSILNDTFFILTEDESEINSEVEYKSSIWIINKDIIQPSTDVSITKKIPSGIYTVGADRSGMFCRKIEVKVDDLYKFSDSIIENLLNEITLFWNKKDLFLENKLVHKRGILLEGYPGTGKTSIISLITNEILNNKGVVFKVISPRDLSLHIDFLQNYFRKIEPETPVITIIEDIDKYVDYEIELLDFLDGKSQINHHVIICTSNNTEEIPDTFLRPSRLDLKVEVPLPNENVRKEYFLRKNVDENLLEELVEKSADLSLADLKELYICIFMLNYSIDDAIEKIVSPRSRKNYMISRQKSLSLL